MSILQSCLFAAVAILLIPVFCGASERFTKVIGYALVLISVISCGCDRDSQVIQPDPFGMRGPLRVASYEAEAAALWLSGELVAPVDLSQDLDLGFSLVRTEYGDSIPALHSIYFGPPWVLGDLVCSLTLEAIEQLRAGEYTDLDSLNALYGFTSIDTSLLFLGFVRLELDWYYHPERLAEIYESVESVEDAHPNWRDPPYDNAYPWRIGGGTSYLFRDGWQDCPSGCVYNRFSYFWVVGNSVKLVGTWDTSFDPDPPAWWTNGQIAYHYYYFGELPIATGIGGD